MPSGIDAALASLKCAPMASEMKVNYNGYDGMKKDGPAKLEITEATIDPAALGFEACQQKLKEYEFRMKKLQEKITALPVTKKNKPEIDKHKNAIKVIQHEGDYRAVLNFVRKTEERDRERKKEEEEEALLAGLTTKKQGKAATAAAGKADKDAAKAKKKEDEEVKPTKVEIGHFEVNRSVEAVVKSAVDGSENAQTELRKQGALEAATVVYAANELFPSKIKRAVTRDHVIKTIKALMWNPAAVLPALPSVLGMLDETKLKTEPNGKATNLCIDIACSGPSGKAMPKYALPVVLDFMGAAAGKWQVKVGTMEVLCAVLQRMNQPDQCPAQLGMAMPRVMAALRGALGDARKEVKKEAERVLRFIGKEMVHNPEIQEMQEDIISSIVDSANMEKAAETMHRLANTTFMNTMDSCSFSLIFPIVSRAMRESNHEAKTKGAVIVGASVNLIADPRFLEPYVAELLPLLQECLMHPTAAIQKAASQSFGTLCQGLPWVCSDQIWPYLMDKLEATHDEAEYSEVERRGGAHALAEVVLKRRDLLSSTIYEVILPRIKDGETNERKAGGLAFFEFIAHLGVSAFLPHIPRVLQTIIDALEVESEVVRNHAVAALKVIIEEYGHTYPRLLLPRFQQALFMESEESRELAMDTFFAFCEKLQDSVKFGQDFLNMETMPTFYKLSLLSSMFIARSDPSYAVRRQAALLWKEKLKSQQKAKTEMLPVLMQVLKALMASGNKRAVACAKACLAENKEDLPEGCLDSVEALEAPADGINEGIIFAGCKDILGAASKLTTEETPQPPQQRGRVLAARVEAEVKKVNLTSPLEWYVQEVIASCCLETKTREEALTAMEEELAILAETEALKKSGSALANFGLTEAIETIFAGVEDEKSKVIIGDKSSDILVRIDDLMLMYGGGHLLLKNTTLEMRRGHRYGVVGRNGAGKTTLMSTMGEGRVKQIPKSLRMLHVRAETLVQASDLTAVEFCKKECDEGTSDESLHKALEKVGYPDDMQYKKVSELSGGWRMKLLLASAMMRDCDILLLDEPTNHLDTQSVKWLVEYLNALTTGAIMVISHDPGFLNAICTDIIVYSGDRKLEYYEGNFDDFRKHRHITSDEEAEALLLGQDYSDLSPGEGQAAASSSADAGAAGDELEEAAKGVTASLLDRQARITFPIPGKISGHNASKPVMELKNVSFAYDEENGPMILRDVSCKLTVSARIGIIGRNGAGKSTLLNLLCGELYPSPGKPGEPVGEVAKNRHLRLAYIAQQHMTHLAEFLNSCPYVYIQNRFQNGWDEALQERLIEPSTPEEAELRKEMAVKYGKYGNEVRKIVGRVVKGSEVLYEVAWMNLEDEKQNTMEKVEKLKMMSVSSLAKAYDERLAAQQAGLDQRPLSQREIVKHLESFGLDEELVLNRLIGTFSAGQKSKLTLGAAFWTKPHMVALDEPTNYIDMETLDSLANALQRFKGGLVVISHSSEFVERVCDETWLVEGEPATITKRTKFDKKKPEA